ncbi:GNAT family N-acetyltransferase [Sesbania bispinosa]|nr:GNAT family N-acetyltransferase [Sesbania bispinosa]
MAKEDAAAAAGGSVTDAGRGWTAAARSHGEGRIAAARRESERWLARRRQPRGMSVAAALAAQGAGSGRARRPEVLETESCSGDGYWRW